MPAVAICASIDDCDCRVGSCSEFHPQLGVTYTVVQQDGALSITDSGDTTATALVGGVYADNHYSVGGVGVIPSYVGQGVVFALEEGMFTVAGGAPTGLHFTIDDTTKATVGGVMLDCDVHGTGSAQYVGVY